MSIPFISDIESSENELEIFKEFAWDFEKDEYILVNNQMKIVEGDEALKVWIYKTLKTERYKYLALDYSYGREFDKYYGKVLTQEDISNIRMSIKESLLINPYIVSIENIDIKMIKELLHIKLEVKTIYEGVNFSGLY